MPTVNSTAGADSAVSSNLCRFSLNVAAVSDMSLHPEKKRPRDARPLPLASFLRDPRGERLVGIGTGLVDGLLVQDQILHGLTDERTRFRIGDDGIADL